MKLKKSMNKTFLDDRKIEKKKEKRNRKIGYREYDSIDVTIVSIR